MRPLLWIIASYIALLVVLFIVPSTKWMLKNDFDYLVHGAYPDDLQGTRWDVDCRFPGGEPEEKKNVPMPVDKVTTLGEVIRQTDRTITRTWNEDFDYLCYIRRYCQDHPDDKVARAYYCKLISSSVTIRSPRDRDYSIESDLKKKKDRCRELLVVTEDINRRDPENLLYPMLRAGAWVNLNEVRNAKLEILRASKMKGYNDYAFEPGLAYVENFESHYGYRGEMSRVLVRTIEVREYSALKSIADWSSRQSDDELTIAMLMITQKLLHDSRTEIGVLATKTMILQALGLKVKKGRKSIEFSQVKERVQELTPVSKAFSFDMPRFTTQVAKLCSRKFADFTGLDTPLTSQNPRAFIQESAPGLAAALILVLPVFFLVHWFLRLKFNSDKAVRAAPHLVWIASLVFGHSLFNLVVSAFVLLSVLVLFLNDRYAGYCKIAGYIVAITLSLFAFGGWLDGVWIAGAYIVASWLSQWKPKPITANVLSVVLGIALIAALYLLPTARIENVFVDEKLAVIASALVLFAFVPRIERLPRWIPIVAMSLYLLGYIGTIGWRYQDNQNWIAESRRLDHAGNLVRDFYGIK